MRNGEGSCRQDDGPRQVSVDPYEFGIAAETSLDSELSAVAANEVTT